MDQTTKWIIKKSITKKSQQQSQSHTKLEGINEDKGKKKYNYCVHEDQNSICVFVFVAIMYGLFWGPCGVGPIRRKESYIMLCVGTLHINESSCRYFYYYKHTHTHTHTLSHSIYTVLEPVVNVLYSIAIIISPFFVM
jgi:hypothetical protein